MIKLIGWLILAVYWYNPLVWLAYALFCRDIELACDERDTPPARLRARGLLAGAAGPQPPAPRRRRLPSGLRRVGGQGPREVGADVQKARVLDHNARRTALHRGGGVLPDRPQGRGRRQRAVRRA
ncbi:MAG: hypothetical protein ACLUEK_10705 [Oscillospiraceae bacterium]